MARVHYIGDAATAAGYRLAGCEVRVPAPGEAAAPFRGALSADADLVLLSAGCSNDVPPEELAAAVLRGRPLVAIVGDAHGRHAPSDVARRARLALGIEP
jgi:vacuolar-type H+-ATPase subunit F/Vma7